LTAKGLVPKIILKMEKVLSSVLRKHSSGYEEISTKTQKISAPYISSPLCYILNKAALAVKFPLRMKYSIVTPIHTFLGSLYGYQQNTVEPKF
jgi:hypothetical protein